MRIISRSCSVTVTHMGQRSVVPSASHHRGCRLEGGEPFYCSEDSQGGSPLSSVTSQIGDPRFAAPTYRGPEYTWRSPHGRFWLRGEGGSSGPAPELADCLHFYSFPLAEKETEEKKLRQSPEQGKVQLTGDKIREMEQTTNVSSLRGHREGMKQGSWTVLVLE